MADGEHSFMATGRMRHATFQDAVGWIDTVWASVTTDTILLGFNKPGLITAESDDSPEEEMPLQLPPELAELRRIKTSMDSVMQNDSGTFYQDVACYAEQKYSLCSLGVFL